MTGDPLDRECPVCFSRDWEIDYVFTGDDEMRVDTCAVCGWPPPDPQGVKEYRDKWAIAGETPHSHPSPSTLRHAAYLADRVEALVEVARAAREAAHPMTPDGKAAPFMWKPANEALLAALARARLDGPQRHRKADECPANLGSQCCGYPDQCQALVENLTRLVGP